MFEYEWEYQYSSIQRTEKKVTILWIEKERIRFVQ